MKTAIGIYVAQKVQEKRKEKGMSRRELADCLNLNESNLRQAENPKLSFKYNLDHLNAIAIILGCNITDFLPPSPIIKGAKYITSTK